LGVEPAAAVEALRRAAVSVLALGGTELVELMKGALAQAEIRVDDRAELQVIVTDDYLRPELEALNRAALVTGRPWFLVQPGGVMPLIGPLFRPGAGPCWACLGFSLRNNRAVEQLLTRHEGRPVLATKGSIELSLRASCNWATLALLRVFAGGPPQPMPNQNQLLALDLRSLLTTAHAVVRRPQCAACGDPSLMGAVGERAIALRPVEKRHTEDGGYRVQSPRQTYERYRHLVSPLTGAVTHLGPIPGRDAALRSVFVSGYMVSPREAVPHGNAFDKLCAGKGRSAEQAQVSALAEAIERYSGVYQGDEAQLRATYEALGAQALSPQELTNFSEEQYRRAALQSATTEARQWVPAPLPANKPIAWTPAWSLTRKQRRYVPLSYCYAEAPREAGSEFCGPCGNGAAAGTCLEEAILQGFFELCERDAAAIWWYNRVRRSAVDLGSFADPYVDALRQDYARLGWQVWVLDLTHDLRIPTCVALAHDARADKFCIGFGCHLDAKLAVLRALTELNQLFELGAGQRAPWDSAKLECRDFLLPHPTLAPIHQRDFPHSVGADLAADIETCMQRLRQADLELIVVDKTRPDLGLCVAQVIVPGMRHFWPRFGPGRLYHVPCAQGWLARPLVEGELNPVPLLV